ncbi:MAG: hypothetical protein KDA89_04945 [Planctomycetaceae bacterium]|nr:hypothetical protein [Planctomycetaceae bacterium]
MTVRRSSFSVDFVTAEMFAAPFWLPKSLTEAITSLHPDLNDGRSRSSGKTAALFRQTERYLLSQIPSMSLDEFMALRDRIWFPATESSGLDDFGTTPIPLHEVALSLASVIKQLPGLGSEEYDRVSTASTDPQLFNRERRFREIHSWFSTALSPDFLAGIISVRAGLRHDDRGVRLCREMLSSGGVSPNVEHLLRSRGFAETHLHVGAAFRFSDIWCALMQVAGRNAFGTDAMQSPGAEWNEGRGLSRLCVLAAICRLVLIEYLTSIGRHRRGTVPTDEQSTLQHFLKQKVDGFEGADRRSAGDAVKIVCDCLNCGQFDLSLLTFRRLQSFMRSYLRIGYHTPVQSLEELHERDPATRFRPVDWRQSMEEFLLRRGLEFLRSQKSPDETLASLFWQYQKIRNTVYRHFVNRPMTPGLQWFVRHFGRLSPAKSIFSDLARLQSAANVSGIRRGLRSLEVRTSPPGSADETFRLVRDVYDFAAGRGMSLGGTTASRPETAHGGSLKSVRSGLVTSEDLRAKQGGREADLPEVGIVFHIVRDRNGGVFSGRPNANGIKAEGAPRSSRRFPSPTNGVTFSERRRYSNFSEKQMIGVRHLASVIEQFPRSLHVIRGFDACTDELGIPTWTLVPLFQRLRRSSVTAKEHLLSRDEVDVPLPRTTIHVGEDFIHLLTGLRLVDEAIDFLDLREGDRLGHALALGFDAERWCTDAGDVTMTIEQRLLDLVWEWGVHTTLGTEADARRLHFLQASIERLSEFVFESGLPRKLRECFHQWPPSPSMLDRLRKALAQPHLLFRVENFAEMVARGELHGKDMLIDETEALIYVYLHQHQVFRRLQATVVVNSSAFAKDHADLQHALRIKVERMNIAVEVNPSSNLSVGDLGDMSQHPVWRLNSPRLNDNQHSIPLTIGSDDPITFASDLPQEYQKLADALADLGYSEIESLEWLDQARETGMRYRFTLPREQFAHRALTRLRQSRHR